MAILSRPECVNGKHMPTVHILKPSSKSRVKHERHGSFKQPVSHSVLDSLPD